MNLSLSSAEFKHIIKTSKPLVFGDLSFKYLPRSQPALGMIVSRQYGNAVERNRLKRRCRSLFKTVFVDEGAEIALIVRPKNQNLSFYLIKNSFMAIYDKICDC